MRCSCFPFDFPVSKRNNFFPLLKSETRCNKLLSGVTRVMTACIAFQLLVASLQFISESLLPFLLLLKILAAGSRKETKKTSSNIFLYTCEMKYEHWTGRSLRCTKQNETFFFVFLDIFSFLHNKICLKFPQKLSFAPSIIFGEKFKYFFSLNAKQIFFYHKVD